MKKWIPAALAVLLAWNVWLTVKLSSSLFTEDIKGDPVVQHTINTYTSDVTEMSSQVQGSLVKVESIAVANTRNVSGVVYDTDELGNVYIFTECQSVRFSDEINVTFDNGFTLPAEVVGFDSSTNLALLTCTPPFKVDTPAKGKSSEVLQGQYTVVLGGRNSRTQIAAVSSGICSASGYYRTSADAGWLTEVLEIDTSVNAESLGGGLFTVGGDFIGLLVSTPAEGTSAKGYAVASDEMQLVYEELRAFGNVTRGSLGIVSRSMSSLQSYEKSMRNLALDLEKGILVTYVYSEAAAAEVLQSGDVILEVDDEVLESCGQMRSVLYLHEAEDTVKLTFLRDGEQMTESVKLK